MEEHSISLEKRVFLLFSLEAKHPVGTCFGFGRPGLFLTAAHAIHDLPIDAVRVVSVGPDVSWWPISEVRRHGSADVAAIYVRDGEPEPRFDCFVRGEPSGGSADFPLGEDVVSVGYPLLADEKPVKRRLMQGHLQASYVHLADPYEYSAFELPFPAFPGQSGSPVIRDWAREEAIGVVTESVRYSTELGEDRTEAHWTIAASLAPLADWMESL